MEKVEGQSAQDQNVGRKHQKGVELPWSIPLSGAGEALCISTTHEDADIIDQQEVRHVLEPVEEIDEDLDVTDKRPDPKLQRRRW